VSALQPKLRMTIRVAVGLPAVATALGATVALVSGAQQQALVFRSGIELVEVDAIVTDRDGNPVKDPTAADFEVFEDGRPQAIQTFRFVELPYEPASPGVEPANDVDPSLVLDNGDGGRRLTFRAEFGLGTLVPCRHVLTVEGRTTGRRGRTESRQVLSASSDGRSPRAEQSLEQSTIIFAAA